MGLEETDLGEQVAIGALTQSDTSIALDFDPSMVIFYGNMTQAALGTEYQSGANTGGGANGLAWCEGYATGSAASEQYVSSTSQNSDSSNAHVAYAGTGDVCYLVATSNAGETIDGRAIAEVTGWDETGLTLNWRSTIGETCHLFYVAYR